ncbi:MAG: imidazole glycerol phosphate synthase subunit HisF [Endomicrobium sp.]|jgi:cyclase|nr:imidazole glycerol phosphate synthase subunit HisF [Endomicrobium sp.]
MLKLRVIPCLDIAQNRVVKGTNFINLRDAGDPVMVAEQYNLYGADEIIFLDISATYENRYTTVDLVEKTAKKIFIPLTVGGGIKNIEDIRNILNAGADKVSLNSAAVYNSRIIKDASNIFGKQCIVVAIDAKMIKNNKWNVFTHGGRIDSGIDAITWANKAVELGAGEILLTSMDKDGTKNGYDLDLLKKISENIPIPVIASGGAGKLNDFSDAYYAGASAVLAASLFHYKEFTIKNVKQYLKSKDIPVRF